MPTWSRRSFGLGLVGGLALLGPHTPLPRVPGWEAQLLLRRLIDLVGVPDPAAVGEAYLAEHGVGPLSELLTRTMVTPEAFAALQRADFEAGRCVRVDGWRLCEADARLCALAALLSGAPASV